METSASEVALRFVDAINAHDVERLSHLMTPDHDGGDETHRGAERMRVAWERYLFWFPDYRVEIRRTLEEESTVALFGSARGTYVPDGIRREDARWEISAAWEAEIEHGKVAVWHVYADVDPVRRIMERFSPGEGVTGD